MVPYCFVLTGLLGLTVIIGSGEETVEGAALAGLAFGPDAASAQGVVVVSLDNVFA